MVRDKNFLFRSTAIFATFIVACLFALPTPSTAAPRPTPTMTALVQAPMAGGNSLLGNFTPTSFSAAPNGILMANGNLTGSVLDPSGNPVGAVSQAVSAPVASASSTCTVLNLTTSPISISLNGATVNLPAITLTVTGQTGTGNELGTILCSISTLLSSATSAVSGLVSLLNTLLSTLGAL